MISLLPTERTNDLGIYRLNINDNTVATVCVLPSDKGKVEEIIEKANNYDDLCK